MKIPVYMLLVIAATAALATEVTTKKVTRDATSEIRDSLKAAKEVYIYEGLPHQIFEDEKLAVEKRRKDTRGIGGFPFYTPKVVAPADLAASLKKILAADDSLAEFSGEKRCGGFHPDYAVAWSNGKQERAVLICFGCGEVLFVADEETQRYDSTFAALRRLEKLLGPFRSKRPPGNSN